MRKYITESEFIQLIEKLPRTKTLDVSVENTYDGNIFVYKFAYVDFNGGTYLYSGGYPQTGVIQDTYMNTFDEELSDIWDEMVDEDTNKPFINE